MKKYIVFLLLITLNLMSFNSVYAQKPKVNEFNQTISKIFEYKTSTGIIEGYYLPIEQKNIDKMVLLCNEKTNNFSQAVNVFFYDNKLNSTVMTNITNWYAVLTKSISLKPYFYYSLYPNNNEFFCLLNKPYQDCFVRNIAQNEKVFYKMPSIYYTNLTMDTSFYTFFSDPANRREYNYLKSGYYSLYKIPLRYTDTLDLKEITFDK